MPSLQDWTLHVEDDEHFYPRMTPQRSLMSLFHCAIDTMKNLTN